MLCVLQKHAVFPACDGGHLYSSMVPYSCCPWVSRHGHHPHPFVHYEDNANQSFLFQRNTFPPGEDSLIPKITVGAERLDFPSAYVDKSVYRSIRLTNTGDTAVMFNFIDDAVISSAANLLKTSQSSLNNGMLGKAFLPASAGGPSFSVKPRAGLLEKNESQLVVFRFSPGEARLYEQSLQILFNGSFSNSHVSNRYKGGVGLL